MKLYDQVFRPSEMVLADGTVVVEKRSRTPFYILLFMAIIVTSLYITQFDFEKVQSNGHQFWKMLFAMFPPNLDYFPSIMQPLADTIKMSFIGSLLGSLFAIPFAILAASNITPNKTVNYLIRMLFTILRTLPTLVTALIATYIWGLGTFAGTVSIFIFSFSYIGKQLFEQIETVDMGAFEAMEALGSSRAKAFFVAVFSQLMPIYISTSLFNFEGNVRYAAILGYVGAGGVGVILNENIGWREYSNVGMILFVLLITVMLIEQISKFARCKLT
ncbi:phosphonate ABC transporter, permease protein PhnE [Enterococcus faecalis]|uniref:phosphonate ABC transporter, permease protein PhnE n=1 Tax=Enterococcus faecalis TaxID=1351 RepID=UPI002DB7036E|nr:phosphonate ABC transporter, permease protein PhnE [Enterococcus faecalis]MEB7792081.1 phosphonate ABC transporter, permease protein PhnE [Enterococcus faecalis]MEB7810069.1 phosphonate ABC transporter, permease protein PhnE [Enterococcus faecalis]